MGRRKTSSLASLAPLASFLGTSSMAEEDFKPRVARSARFLSRSQLDGGGRLQASRRSLRSLPFSEPARWRRETSSLASLAPLASFLGASSMAEGDFKPRVARSARSLSRSQLDGGGRLQASHRSLRSLPFSEPARWRRKTSSLASLAPLAPFLGASSMAEEDFKPRVARSARSLSRSQLDGGGRLQASRR